MTCREGIEFLSEYLSGELPPAERLEFEKHLEECPDCVAYLKSFQEALKLGKRAFEISEGNADAMPEDLVQAILAARRRGS
jgi:anti-sigma factor RsiW